jgi:carnitine O-acetyltransferase
MVKQLAYGKMMGKPAVTYESAQTRKFRLGRTEVIRASSNQSKAFVEAMLDKSQTVCQPLIYGVEAFSDWRWISGCRAS